MTSANAQSALTWQGVIETKYPGGIREESRGAIADMVLADNGDIVVAGFVPGERGPTDAWVARFSPDGSQIWSKQFGLPVRDEVLDLSIAQDGSILVGGVSYLRPLTGNAFAAKLTPQGELLWNLMPSQPGDWFIGQIETLKDGSILVLGGEHLAEDAALHTTVVKLDSMGGFIWRFGPWPPDDGSYPADAGFEPFDAFATRRTDNDFEIHDMHEGAARCVVLGADRGELLGSACGAPPKKGAGFDRSAVTYSGGKTDSNFLESDPLLQKYDETGGLIWERVLASSDGDGLNSVAATPDGGVVGAGYRAKGTYASHNRDGLLVKLDASGKVLWTRILGGERQDELNSVAVMSDGSIIAAGYTALLGNTWNTAPWLLRLNSSGNLEGSAQLEPGRTQTQRDPE